MSIALSRRISLLFSSSPSNKPCPFLLDTAGGGESPPFATHLLTSLPAKSLSIIETLVSPRSDNCLWVGIACGPPFSSFFMCFQMSQRGGVDAAVPHSVGPNGVGWAHRLGRKLICQIVLADAIKDTKNVLKI